ncbi:hypothetical protein [Streptosporangium vulgare]|uniref:MinD/ParA family ATP-binding protein n=1 Tax=Streptosporangium vulgare TaxID=46190 RepID=UPI0031CEF847
MSIRAVPSGSATADPVTPAVPVTGSSRGEAETRVRRVESVVGRDSSGGWRRLAQVVIGPGGGGRTDGSEIDEARARAVFSGSRRVVVLGCTGGAGQTTTALMLGHTLARYREDRILAVDASTGSHALSSRIQGESPETLSSLLSGLDDVQGYLGMRAYTSRCASGLEVLAGDSDAGAEQRLSDRALFSDRRLGQVMDMLDRHYKTIVVDPAAALAARVLPYADQLVLVVPASEDGPDAVAMTYEWLDGHGCADLRHRAVMVVNGVSRRSMADVEQAEAVARGRCRAIVRVPWEDALAPGRADRVEPSHLRAPGRRAYLALAGVVVAGFGNGSGGSTQRGGTSPVIPRARGDVVSGRDEVQVVSGQAGVRVSGLDPARVNGSYEVRTSGPNQAGTGCFERNGEVQVGGRRGIRAGEGSGDHGGRGKGHGGHEGRAARAVGEGL